MGTLAGGIDEKSDEITQKKCKKKRADVDIFDKVF
jgi:hypothetical protein